MFVMGTGSGRGEEPTMHFPFLSSSTPPPYHLRYMYVCVYRLLLLFSRDVAQPKQSSGGNWEESGTGDRGVQDATNAAVSDH